MVSFFPAFLKKHQTLVIFIFFAAYLLLGLAIYDDYGVSTDEVFQNDKAVLNLDYITGKSDELLTYPDRHYSAVLAIPLYLVTKNFPDTRADYLFRHLVTFLIFYASAIFFYLSARRMKLPKPIALIGTAIYIFHPHIFSHSFYNIKDSPFLALYMVSIYTLLRWSEKPTALRFALLHGFISGLLVILRLPGLLMWAISFLIWLWMLILNPREWKKLIFVGGAYAIAAALTLFVFMPALWHDPIGEVTAFLSMDPFTWEGKELFMGNLITPAQFPRYYLPMNILLTTPLLFTGFLVFGTFFAVWDLIMRRALFTTSAYPKIILLLSFYLPIFYIMAARPVIYNGWRHAFFVYAPFALLAAMGIEELWKFVTRWNHTALRRAARSVIIVAITIQAIWLAVFLIISHPYEHVFYNRLAGADLSVARTQYRFDYWGLSYREGLDIILANDSRDMITVCGGLNAEVRENLKIVPLPQRNRIRVIPCSDTPDYYLTNYHYRINDDGRGGELWRSIDVLNARVLGIYKLTTD